MDVSQSQGGTGTLASWLVLVLMGVVVVAGLLLLALAGT